MRITSRRKAIVFFLSLGVCLAAVAVAVGFGWIILNWREGLKVFLGVIFFSAITAGLILNTIFLVREIRRNEQHDSFINAVTHERSEEHTSELQSRGHLVCRLLLEKKNNNRNTGSSALAQQLL